jgi:hypothetical protein
LAVFTDIRRDGRRADLSNFKTVDYKAAATALSARRGTEYTWLQVKNKWSHLKSRWDAWQAHLRYVSGWNSVGADGAPTAESDVEDAYFEANKNCRPFRDAVLPYLDEMTFLCGDRQPTGDYTQSNLDVDASDGISIIASDDEDEMLNANPLATPSARSTSTPSTAASTRSSVRSHRRRLSPVRVENDADVRLAAQAIARRQQIKRTVHERAMDRLKDDSAFFSQLPYQIRSQLYDFIAINEG